VRVVLSTSGDAFPEGVELTLHVRRPEPRDFRDYGSLRERETITAMQVLGVHRAHLLFLGFPDGGMCLIASKYLSAKSRAFESPYTDRVEPPASEQVIRGVTYRGTDIRREIEALVLAYQPTLIALPHPEDRHPDHCATSLFTREALDVLAKKEHRRLPRVLYYLIHYDQWPNLDSDPASPFLPPSSFPTSEGSWRMLTLTPDEAALKRRAMNAYATQHLVIGNFLNAFTRPNELFLEGAVTSPPECWCDATHVATEVPPGKYRHPPSRRP
jgi:LmbE family N-acetylglucosaminyl deacetylase